MKPNPIFSFMFIFLRIFVFLKILTLFILTSVQPDKHPISDLTWWIYFLVFDVWVSSMVPNPEQTKDENED